MAWYTLVPEEISNEKPKPYFNRESKPVTTDKDFFCNLVGKGIDAIEHGTFEKVVVSRP